MTHDGLFHIHHLCSLSSPPLGVPSRSRPGNLDIILNAYAVRFCCSASLQNKLLALRLHTCIARKCAPCCVEVVQWIVLLRGPTFAAALAPRSTSRRIVPSRTLRSVGFGFSDKYRCQKRQGGHDVLQKPPVSIPFNYRLPLINSDLRQH
jgi:hypothetical protein